MIFQDFKTTILNMVDGDNDPVVVFAALWPILMQMEGDKKQLPYDILDIFLGDDFKGRDVLMPTFACGYGAEKFCDLDKEPSTTGLLSELFRTRTSSSRSLSAFFSFNIIGPNAESFSKMKAIEAWGSGSAYEWMENHNAHFLMLGTHPTHCSYVHRVEWLAREHINYRYDKKFEGLLRSNGQDVEMEEVLYVRSLQPELINDFTTIEDDLLNNGMTLNVMDGVNIAHMRAQDMRNAYLPLLKKDPYITVKNRHEFENKKESN